MTNNPAKKTSFGPAPSNFGPEKSHSGPAKPRFGSPIFHFVETILQFGSTISPFDAVKSHIGEPTRRFGSTISQVASRISRLARVGVPWVAALSNPRESARWIGNPRTWFGQGPEPRHPAQHDDCGAQSNDFGAQRDDCGPQHDGFGAQSSSLGAQHFDCRLQHGGVALPVPPIVALHDRGRTPSGHASPRSLQAAIGGTVGTLIAATLPWLFFADPESASAARRDEPPCESSGGLYFGGPTDELTGGDRANCIPPEARAETEARIQAYYREHGPEPFVYSDRATNLYDFWPQGGNEYQDIFMNNFVDMDPSAAIQDWDCTSRTYNGHTGHDCELRSFAEKIIGVPVFAIKPGTVLARDDGHPDMNTNPAPTDPANYVIIGHGGGHRTLYWHLANGSVSVQVNDVVAAGQQIGLAASSGFSNWPHLHFEVQRNGVVNEPYTGTCNPGTSGWANQTPIFRVFRPRDFAFIRTVPPNYSAFRWASTGQVALSDAFNRFWLTMYNLPAASNFRVRYYRPSGTLEFDSGALQFLVNGAPNGFARTANWWWQWNIAGLHSIAGNWRMRLDVNGDLAVDAPFVVSANPDPDFNRPPAALGGLAFDPPAPGADDVIFCRVQSSPVNEDPDYEVVRYTYVWTVGGVEVRRITSAALSDAIRVGAAPAGSVVRCTVTPSDGRLEGPTSTIFVRVAGGCIADMDDGTGTGTPDGGVTIDDLLYYITIYADGVPRADVDDGSSTGTPDGGVTIDDLLYYLQRFEAGC